MPTIFAKFSHAFRKYLERVVAVCLLVEGALFITSTLKVWSSEYVPTGLSALIDAHLMAITAVTNLFLMLCTLTLLYLIRNYRRKRSTLEHTRSMLDRCRAPERLFRVMAHTNAKCDMFLVERLFIQPFNAKSLDVVMSNIPLATSAVSLNIVRILNSTKDIISAAVGGAPCAACVKVFTDRNDTSQIGEMRLITLARDDISDNDRQGVRMPSRVNENTANIGLIKVNGGEHFYLCNDLKAARAKREFTTVSADWERYYNATLVVPIPDLAENAVLPMRGLLCVDSMGGKFDDDLCVHYLRELAWRIGVMLYRLEGLGRHSPVNAGKSTVMP
jgi:hypothetical protein